MGVYLEAAKKVNIRRSKLFSEIHNYACNSINSVVEGSYYTYDENSFYIQLYVDVFMDKGYCKREGWFGCVEEDRNILPRELSLLFMQEIINDGEL